MTDSTRRQAAAAIPGSLLLAAFGSNLDPAIGARLQAGLNRGYPGLAMAAQRQGQRLRGASAGFSSLERRRPLRLDDAFHIGSITKTFTAVNVLRLVDIGMLKLGQRLAAILGPAVARVPYADRITVAQLLDHSAGVYPTNNDPAYLNTVIGVEADPNRQWSFADIVALADKDRQPPSHPPGERHTYSDTHYALLGMILEKVSGRPYKKFTRDNLLRPLGLHSTSFYSDDVASDGRPRPRVDGYMQETDEIRAVIAVNDMFKPVPGRQAASGRLLNTTLAAERLDTAGGLISTLPDLVRFGSALFRGRLLSPSSQTFLTEAGEGLEESEPESHRTRTLQAVRKAWGMVLYKEGDGPGGNTALMAYLPARDEIWVGFVNRFGGDFDHVDFMMDAVIGPTVVAETPDQAPRLGSVRR